jgi:hypothetical protein
MMRQSDTQTGPPSQPNRHLQCTITAAAAAAAAAAGDSGTAQSKQVGSKNPGQLNAA